MRFKQWLFKEESAATGIDQERALDKTTLTKPVVRVGEVSRYGYMKKKLKR